MDGGLCLLKRYNEPVDCQADACGGNEMASLNDTAHSWYIFRACQLVT